MLPYILIGLGVLFLVLYFFSAKKNSPQQSSKTIDPPIAVKPEKISYGRVRIYFGTQTGTAAKLAEQLAQQGTQQGFNPQVIDLKDLHINHFESINEISLFLLSNTGQGDPPENTVKFIKILKKKQNLDEVKEIDWSKLNYSVFGLGNTQYEHYNKTGIDVDSIIQKNGGKRIYKLGLGDDNCSLEDDFTEWRKQLWKTLKQFRKSNPFKDVQPEQKLIRKISSQLHESFNYLSKLDPIYANYKLFFKNKTQDYAWQDEDLDFKTKASLKAESAIIRSIQQLRQNTLDGSTIQIEVELPNQPEYQTAGNIALYSKNDPKIIEQVASYFGILPESMNKKIGLSKLKEDKKIKLNFIPDTILTLLQQSIDIQGKLSKSVLKKLAKYESKNPNYFTQNSLKTTKQFERITDQKQWYYLIRIIKQFQVKISFEDFVQLSDSMAPRLFTIASHSKTQKNVIVAASLLQKGLISKYILTKPSVFKAELRKSTFTDAMKWKKVIFIAAGTGFAPFRGYLQEKVYNVKQRQEGKNPNIPIISLFFGCKHETGDFIYKEQILGWKQQGIINRLHLAFSRDSQNKVYVQDLLKKEEQQLKQLGHCQDTAIYICGSLAMGKSIIDLLSEVFGGQKVKLMQQKGRIVKQLW